jgi:exonuclease SbcD
MGIPFTFVHAADLHLDSPFKGLTKVPASVKDRLRESTFRSFARVVETALREEADFVVLAGDLYDAADRSLRAQLRLQRMLTELTGAGIGVYIVHGNHDPESGRQARLDWPAGVHVFGSGAVECKAAYRRDGEWAANIYGISYPTPAVSDNLALRFARNEGAPFHLALLHGNVDGDSSHDNYAPCRLAELTAAGFDYWALGHVHERRVLHEYPHVVYPGNVQGRSVRETGPRGAYLVRVADTGMVDMQFRDTAEVLWMEIVVSIEGAEREQELKERLLCAAEEAGSTAGGRPVVIRLRLEGRGLLHDTLLQETAAEEWLEELQESLGSPDGREDWIWPESLSVRTRGMADYEGMSAEEGFVGELVRRGLHAAGDAAAAMSLSEEALDSLRRQPRIREWLASRTDNERQDLARRALELAVSLLRDEDAG